MPPLNKNGQDYDEQVLLSVEDLHLRFGGLNALSGVSFKVQRGDIQAIIGPNGAGKTCILNCICRFYQPYRGRVIFDGKDISKYATHKVSTLGIARSFQNIELFKGMTVLDNIKLGHHVHMHSGFISAGSTWARPNARDAGAQRDRGAHHRPAGDRGHPQAGGGHACPMACKSGWSWPGPWPCGPRFSCSWTNPWPA